MKDYVVDSVSGRKLYDPVLIQPKLIDNMDTAEMSEYIVRFEWEKVYNREEAKTFKGISVNQNVVCKLRDRFPVNFLLDKFRIKKLLSE